MAPPFKKPGTSADFEKVKVTFFFSLCMIWNEFTQPFLNLEGVSKYMSQLKKSFDIQHQIQHLKTYPCDMIHA